MVGGMVQASPSAIFFMVPRRILPERVLGSRGHGQRELERGDRADALADQGDQFALDLGGVAGDPRFQHHEAARLLALQRVADADDGAFGDIRVGRQHRLHARRSRADDRRR